MTWMETMASALKVTVDGGDKLKIRVSYNVGTLLLFLGRAVAVKPPPAPVAAPAAAK